MNSKKKALALIVIAVASLCAIGVATAQAAPEFEAREAVEPEGEAEASPVHATLDAAQVGTEPVKLTLAGQSITCEVATGSATLAAPSSTLTLSPTYGKCKVVFLGIPFPTEIKVGSCTYVHHAKEETEADVYKAQLDISCPTESKILITIKNTAGTKTKCLIHVPSQSGLSTVKVKNMTEAETEDVTLVDEVEGVKETVTNGEETCGLITPGEYTSGKMTGNTTVTATGKGEVPPPNLRMAQKFHFAAEEEEIAFFGTQNTNQEFGFDLGKVKCTQMLIENPSLQFVNNLSPDVEGTELGAGPSYEGCEINKEKVEINLNVCWFRIAALRVEAGWYEAGTYIENCFPKMRIEIKAPNCTIFIPQQSGFKKEGLRSVTLTNVGAGKNREVTATFVISGMKYEEEGEGCKQPGKATANGTYSGTERLTAAEPAGPFFRGLWVEKT